jgi:P pilus assembly chaperone PapD
MKYIFAAITCLALALIAGLDASAQLAIDKLWIDFENPSDTRGDLLLVNESQDRYYIDVTSFEIVNPGTEEEERVTYADPEELGLLVTPNRMILDPGQSRSLRVIRIPGDMSSDRVYRVRIEPKLGDISAEGFESERTMVIKLLTAYEVLVTSRPRNAAADIAPVREDGAIKLTNSGNTNALIYDVYLCEAGIEPDEEGTNCNKVSTRRLHPGNEWTIPTETAEQRLYAKVKMTDRGQDATLIF